MSRENGRGGTDNDEPPAPAAPLALPLTPLPLLLLPPAPESDDVAPPLLGLAGTRGETAADGLLMPPPG